MRAYYSRFVTRLGERWPYGFAVGLLLFVLDWSGYDKWEPDLFFPKPLSEVWWHLPMEVVAIIVFMALWPRWPDWLR
jgi:hypothetical protein